MSSVPPNHVVKRSTRGAAEHYVNGIDLGSQSGRDKTTTLRDSGHELRWNQAYYRLAQRP